MALSAARVAFLCAGLATAAAPTLAAGTQVSVGLGRYFNGPRDSGSPLPPAAPYVTGAMVGRAVPTNQWYSSVVYQRWSQPLYAHPVSYRAVPQGFEVGVPRKEVGTYGGSREVRFLHQPSITVRPLGFQPEDARLADHGDWHVVIRFGTTRGEACDTTVLHGSPFSYYACRGGDIRLDLASRPTDLALQPLGEIPDRVVRFTLDGQAWAAFAPRDARWEVAGDGGITLRTADGRANFSLAALPDAAPATLARFAGAAFAFPTATRVEWQFDEAGSRVRSTFSMATQALEGASDQSLLGLYPHQWKSLAGGVLKDDVGSYATVRGRLRLIEGNRFTVERTFHGFTPHWGPVVEPVARASIESLLVGDLAKVDSLYTKMGRGTYWTGKALGASAQLLSVAEAQGKTAARDALLNSLRSRLQSWFDGSRKSHFFHDPRTGTLVGVPEEYASITAMNDHHFHYGYWIMAAAHVALRDRTWASRDQWGGMVDLLIADIATAERGRADFPFLRNFDAYEGHSWASGNADFDAGNNQESSSEAVNAWAGLVLWAEATGNRALRDLGVFLYTSEIASLGQYWFDLDRDVLAPEFGQPFASMVFGGKYSYNTWWTQEPRQIFGINLLPLTPASTYLAQDPGYLPRVAARLPAERQAYHARGGDDGTPPDIWQDVIAGAVAVGDASAGLALWKRNGSVEVGETRTRTQHWLARLGELGTPDWTVTADTTLYAVFRRGDGTRTYLAWNTGDAARRVTFSDGTVLEVAPRALAQARQR